MISETHGRCDLCVNSVNGSENGLVFGSGDGDGSNIEQLVYLEQRR